MNNLYEYRDEFLYFSESKGISYKTLKSYKYSLNKFLDYLLKKDIKLIENLKANDVTKFILEMKESGHKISYINTFVRIVKLFLRYLKDEEVLILNIDKIFQLKTDQNVIETFTDEEVTKLLESIKGNHYIPIRDKTIIMLLLDTGVRVGEVGKILTTHVRDDMTILINGKGNKQRFVPISPALKRQLIKYERAKRGYFGNEYRTDYYFCSRNNTKITNFIVQNLIIKYGIKVGIDRKKLHPHNFRRYASIKMLRNQLDVYSISRLLGHSDLKTTSRYLRSIQDADIIEKAINYSPLASLNLQ